MSSPNCGTAAARQHERRLQHGRLRGAPGKGPPPRPVVAVNRLSQGMEAIDYRAVCDYLLSRGMRLSAAARNATISYCVECDYLLPRGLRLSATARDATICYRVVCDYRLSRGMRLSATAWDATIGYRAGCDYLLPRGMGIFK